MKPLEKLWTLALIAGVVVALFALVGCTSTDTTYNIHFHPKAFRVAETLSVEPGQGGDATDSSGNEATASGGTEMSPGNTNWIRGFADQGNIFNIGTATTPTTTAETDANLEATIPVK